MLTYRITWQTRPFGGEWWAVIYDADGRIVAQHSFYVQHVIRHHKEMKLQMAREWCMEQGVDIV